MRTSTWSELVSRVGVMHVTDTDRARRLETFGHTVKPVDNVLGPSRRPLRYSYSVDVFKYA